MHSLVHLGIIEIVEVGCNQSLTSEALGITVAWFSSEVDITKLIMDLFYSQQPHGISICFRFSKIHKGKVTNPNMLQYRESMSLLNNYFSFCFFHCSVVSKRSSFLSCQVYNSNLHHFCLLCLNVTLNAQYVLIPDYILFLVLI